MSQSEQSSIQVNDEGLYLKFNTIHLGNGVYQNIIRRGVEDRGFFTTRLVDDRYSSDLVKMGSRFSRKNLYAVHNEFLAKAQEEQNLNTLKEWALEQ